MPVDLVIVTPQGEAYRGPVDAIVLPGTEGDFGVLEHHERFVSPLRVGEVAIDAPGGGVFAAISEGFAAVNGSEVAVLVESCEVAGDIDVARAELALERAREGLAKLGADEARERFEEFEAALERAENRLAVSRRDAEKRPG